MGEQLELPGMRPPVENDTPMVGAAQHTLAALNDADMLGPRSALLVQLTIQLSRAIDAGVRSGRASAVAMASRELRETLLMLDPPPEDGEAGAEAQRQLAEFMAKLEYAANHGGQLPGPGVPLTGDGQA